MSEQTSFQWHCQPQATNLIEHQLAICCEKSSFLQKLQQELLEKTSTCLFDWVDHIECGFSDTLRHELETTGFELQLSYPSYQVFAHQAAKLPLVVVKDQTHSYINVAIVVESIAD